ncbi:MAG: tetratricopeptide repeat protein [Ardenticatenales bacterium]|nr:tetratricopeptide repeat protein [Ardenticatenales bacterium]
MAKKDGKEQSDDAPESLPNPGDMTVPEIKELVASGELSTEQLVELKEAEAEDKGRATALNIIEHAIEQPEAGSAGGADDASDSATGAAELSDGKDAKTGADAITSGRVHLERGNYAQAQIYFERAQTLFEKGKDEPGISSCLEEMAILALLRGEQDLAQSRYQEALNRYREQGNRDAQIDVLQQLGLLYRMRGDKAQMRASYDEARALTEGSDGATS